MIDGLGYVVEEEIDYSSIYEVFIPFVTHKFSADSIPTWLSVERLSG